MYSNKGFLIGFSIFILNLFDALSTYVGLEFGLVKEKNPLMLYMMDLIGNWIMVLKTLTGAILFGLIYIGWNKINKTIKGLSISVLAIYSLLGIYHFCLLCWYGIEL